MQPIGLSSKLQPHPSPLALTLVTDQVASLALLVSQRRLAAKRPPWGREEPWSKIICRETDSSAPFNLSLIGCHSVITVCSATAITSELDDSPLPAHVSCTPSCTESATGQRATKLTRPATWLHAHSRTQQHSVDALQPSKGRLPHHSHQARISCRRPKAAGGPRALESHKTLLVVPRDRRDLFSVEHLWRDGPSRVDE
ncbi:hypothetical protein LZ31DRAFT_196379 [Colletotrichum somersetense]|nr:hypothetical protein LZ31DRAFT_196379 [Colletotrichum somersetense]